MTEKQFQNLLEKYLHGQADKKEIKLVEDFYRALQDENRADHQWLAGQEKDIKDQVKARIDRSIGKDIFRNNRRNLLRVAAGIAVLVMCSLGYVTYQGTDGKEVEYVHLSTNDGKRKTIRLDDGTQIRLNVNSRLDYPKSFDNSRERKVFLEGEAFFKVAKNVKKPFVVMSNGLKTKVLGTQFNINGNKEEVNVYLVEGSVQVEADTTIKILEPNQKAIYSPIQKSIGISNPQQQQELAWMSDTFTFQNEPLGEVAKAVGKRFNVEIYFREPGIKEKRVTAHFEHQSLNTILISLTKGGDLKFRTNDNQKIEIYE
ncbi:MAG: FecR domain-containing protein [Sediminicola sp.]|tara:strand:+ start:48198 stop:49142 length:945 start_codon:yes stop_codon:yes gene_type:complete